MANYMTLYATFSLLSFATLCTFQAPLPSSTFPPAVSRSPLAAVARGGEHTAVPRRAALAALRRRSVAGAPRAEPRVTRAPGAGSAGKWQQHRIKRIREFACLLLGPH